MHEQERKLAEEGYMGARAPAYTGGRTTDLQPLSDLDNWQIEKGEPDIRGWDVVDQNGDNVGSISELLVSTSAGEAIFAVVSYGGTLGMGGQKVLVPIDMLDLDRQNERTTFNGQAERIKDSPKYKDDTMDFGPFYDYWGTRPGMAMAEHERERTTGRVIPEVEERLEVETRPEQVGEVTIRKEVETHPETVHETVSRTRVRVYRRDVEPGRELKPGEKVLREGETIAIPVMEEKLQVEKHPVVTGEVVIEPETVQEEVTATEQVRKEHVEVKATGEAELEEEEEPERMHRR